MIPGEHLLWAVQHQEDPVMRREGLDLHSEVLLPYLAAILGGTITVDTLEGSAGLPVPPGRYSTILICPSH